LSVSNVTTHVLIALLLIHALHVSPNQGVLLHVIALKDTMTMDHLKIVYNVRLNVKDVLFLQKIVINAKKL